MPPAKSPPQSSNRPGEPSPEAQTQTQTAIEPERKGVNMRNQKIAWIGGLLTAAALTVATVSATSAQTQPAPGPGGMMGGTGTTGSTTGPGPMGQGGVSGGQGMMGGLGAQQATPIGSLDAAKQAFEGYVERTGNPDLALDEVMQ